jgi:Ca-activated chloride channel family protein
MLLATLTLAAAIAASSDEVPYLRDPIVYPPEVMEDDPVESGQIRVKHEGGQGALVLEHSSVVAEVHAGLARVTLIQWFHNPYEQSLEASYLFPLPPKAAVDRMDMTCGDRLIEGRVMEREAAREAYEEARRDGRKAALLEQERPNLFTQSISSLCPGEEVQITLQYVEQLSLEDGHYELVFPMTPGPRYSPPWVEDRARLETPYTTQPHNSVDITVYIDEGLPVRSLWSDSHDISVQEEGPWGAEVTTADEEIVPDRDFVLEWSLEGEQPGVSALTHRPRADEPGVIAVSFEPPQLGERFVARPRELLFVIDSSGSMRGWPYESARAAVLLALEEMGPQDSFNLVRFSGAATSLFDRPQPSTASTRARAREWLSHFEGGGTSMDEGILHSLRLPGDPEAMRLVLMLTDGYVGGEQRMFDLVRANIGQARMFSFGVGSSVNRYLLEGLALRGRGDVIYHYGSKPLSDAVAEFYGRIAHPALSDIRIDWGELEVSEQYPMQIPDLWAGQPLRVIARYEPGQQDRDGMTATTITVSGVLGRRRVFWELPLELPAVSLEHEALPTLWARHKIEDLRFSELNRDPAGLKAAITEVALEHGLVSEYTSLVAIDDEPSPCGPSSQHISVPNAAPAGVAMVGGAPLGQAGTLGAMGTGIGGLLGAKGAQRGVGGIAGTGSGYGGGGSGRIALRGSSSKRSSYGTGGGSFGAIAADAAGASSGSPIILGALDRSLIDGVVQRHINAIRYCYQRQLQQSPGLQGKIVIEFVVAADGSVSLASVKSSTMGDAEVEQCLTARFLRMQFPPPGGGGIVLVRYPFLFSAN